MFRKCKLDNYDRSISVILDHWLWLDLEAIHVGIIENGQVILCGTPDSLLSMCGLLLLLMIGRIGGSYDPRPECAVLTDCLITESVGC